MDFILNLIDQIQKSDFFLAIRQLAPIDWIVVFVVLWGMLQGGRKGFGGMFGKIVEVILAGVLVLAFYPQVSDFLRQLIPALPGEVTNPIAFVLLSIFIWLSVSWSLNALGKFLKLEITGSLTSLGGLLAGGLYFFLLLSFISQFLLLFPADVIQKFYQKGHSYTGPVLAQLMPAIQKAVVPPAWRIRKKAVLNSPRAN